jgi:hypothetical protein
MLGLVAALAVPTAFADETETKTKSTTTTTTTDSTMTTEPAPPTTDTSGTTTPPTGTTTETQPVLPRTPTAETGTTYGYTPPAAATTTTTTTSSDYYVREEPVAARRPHVRSGVGLNAFGQVGTKDSARLGWGGRVEFVLPFGLSLGGSYQVSYTSDFDKTGVRPLLGEAGWAIPVGYHVEVRPMVGIGYAFATVSRDTNQSQPVTANQTIQASGTAFAGGFDVAPGAKLSYVGGGFEIYTMPKYHFITEHNFLGVEVGAGARF